MIRHVRKNVLTRAISNIFAFVNRAMNFRATVARASIRIQVISFFFANFVFAFIIIYFNILGYRMAQWVIVIAPMLGLYSPRSEHV